MYTHVYMHICICKFTVCAGNATMHLPNGPSLIPHTACGLGVRVKGYGLTRTNP